MRTNPILVLTLQTLLALATHAQTVPKKNLCDPPEEICQGAGCEKRIPVVFGDPYLVPPLKIQLIDKHTNKPAAEARITLNYRWKWFEYPFTEAPLGVWSEASYSTTCSANEDGVIEVAAFKVEPHGWYKGIYSLGKKPKFSYIEVGYELPYVGSKEKKCYTYTEFSRAQIDKCRKSGRCEFQIKDGCPPEWR